MTISDGIEELFYTQRLVNNDVTVRMKTFKKLHTFLKKKSLKKGFTYNDFLKIWKGLYYCMYNADLPLVQEDLAERISCLIHQLPNNSQKMLFFKVCLDTFAREWTGTDKFRLDKFWMLFTRVIRQCLFFLLNADWAQDLTLKVANTMEGSIVCPSDDTNAKPLELKMYLADIIVDEILKVSKGTLPDSVLLTLLYPFFKVIAVSDQHIYVNAIEERILHKLIYESEVGVAEEDIEEEEEDDEEDVEEDEEEVEEDEEEVDEEEVEEDEEEVEEDEEATNQVKNKNESAPKDESNMEEQFVMDPRAGGVDVVLPQLKIDYRVLIKTLRSLTAIKEISASKRRILRRHASLFSKISRGVFPFKQKVLPDETRAKKKSMAKAVKRLQNPEKYEDVPLIDERYKYQRKKPRSMKVKKKRRKYLKGRLTRQEALDILKKQSKVKQTRNKKLDNFSQILGTSITPETQNKANPVQPTVKSVQASNEAGMGKKTKKKKKKNQKQKNTGTEQNVTKLESTDSAKVVKGKKRKAETTEPSTIKEPQTKKAAKLQKKPSEISPKTEKTKSPTFEKRVGKTVATSTDMKKMPKNKKGNLKQKQKGNIKRTQDVETTTLPAKKTKTSSFIITNITKKQTSPASSVKTSQKKTKEKDPWQEPLKDGETEIIIRSKRFAQMKNPKAKINLVLKKTAKRNTKGKTLKINLGKNQEHDFKHYTKVLKSSPGIPFSAHKKPLTSVLKSKCSDVTTKISF